MSPPRTIVRGSPAAAYRPAGSATSVASLVVVGAGGHVGLSNLGRTRGWVFVDHLFRDRRAGLPAHPVGVPLGPDLPKQEERQEAPGPVLKFVGCPWADASIGSEHAGSSGGCDSRRNGSASVRRGNSSRRSHRPSSRRWPRKLSSSPVASTFFFVYGGVVLDADELHAGPAVGRGRENAETAPRIPVPRLPDAADVDECLLARRRR